MILFGPNRLLNGALGVLLALASTAFMAAANAQDAGGIAAVPRECQGLGAGDGAVSPLPNVVEALRKRKRIVILAIGSTSHSMRGPVRGGRYATVERILEEAFKPLDVQIVHRGVSGELAENAAQRIRNEVALTNADLVLWQVGTADALANVPIFEFRNTVAGQIRWLKEHKIDVIIIGLRYAASLARDPQYVGMRNALAATAKAENVIRLSRFNAELALAKVKRENDEGFGTADVTEASTQCTAEYLARAIAAGLFVRKAPTIPGAAPPPK